MAPETPFALRWGIIGAGSIATYFVKDFLVDPKTRDVHDIVHVLQAVGSRSVDSAKKFVSNVLPDDEAYASRVKCYGSYQELYDAPDVDVVYIASPHTFHYQNAKDALQSGKNILCEKPFTVTAEEMRELASIATEKKRFMMEAVWTRFQPLSFAVEELVFSGKYGALKRMTAELSMDMKPDTMDISHRCLNPELGGGALLDLGPYPMIWTMLMAYRNPNNKSKSGPKKITAMMTLDPRTQVDLTTNWSMEFDGVGTAVCNVAINALGNSQQCVVLNLEHADIHIQPPTNRPSKFTVFPKVHPKSGLTAEPPLPFEYPIHEGFGFHYEADETARCIRDGKLESERMPLKESILVMEVFDECRKLGGYLSPA